VEQLVLFLLENKLFNIIASLQAGVSHKQRDIRFFICIDLFL